MSAHDYPTDEKHREFLRLQKKRGFPIEWVLKR